MGNEIANAEVEASRLGNWLEKKCSDMVLTQPSLTQAWRTLASTSLAPMFASRDKYSVAVETGKTQRGANHRLHRAMHFKESSVAAVQADSSHMLTCPFYPASHQVA